MRQAFVGMPETLLQTFPEAAERTSVRDLREWTARVQFTWLLRNAAGAVALACSSCETIHSQKRNSWGSAVGQPSAIIWNG